MRGTTKVKPGGSTEGRFNSQHTSASFHPSCISLEEHRMCESLGTWDNPCNIGFDSP